MTTEAKLRGPLGDVSTKTDECIVEEPVRPQRTVSGTIRMRSSADRATPRIQHASCAVMQCPSDRYEQNAQATEVGDHTGLCCITGTTQDELHYEFHDLSHYDSPTKAIPANPKDFG